jgi:hypothetical protein
VPVSSGISLLFATMYRWAALKTGYWAPGRFAFLQQFEGRSVGVADDPV